MDRSKTVYNPQLGIVPADESKIIYLDEEHHLDVPPNMFIVVVDRFTKGRMDTQIITAGRPDLMHKSCLDRNYRWDNNILDGETHDTPFLTDEETAILVEANKDLIHDDGEGLETNDGTPFYYELAQKCCDRANSFIEKKMREQNG